MSAAARGPLAFLLRSQAGQWVTISLGAMYAFPEQAKLLLGDSFSVASLAKQMSGFNVPTIDSEAVAKAASQPQTIVSIRPLLRMARTKSSHWLSKL